MANIVILGAGVMGSALSVPAVDAGNNVTVIGSPLDDAIVSSVNASRHHPSLNVDIPDAIRFVGNSEADSAILGTADIIVIGVSSPGVSWATDRILQANASPSIISLVTKGLVARDAGHAPYTYADTLDTVFASLINASAGSKTTAARIVGIGGPCIARELALRIPTRVTFAAHQIEAANEMRQHFATPYYRITTDADIVAVEACAALKNFLCIGVSAMISAYQIDSGSAKNPVAGLYNQAVHELLTLSQWIAAESSIQCTQQGLPVAFDLAGMGDLHVTVGGGRNSRLGNHLGQGELLSAVQSGAMKGVTVEGVDTGRNLSASCRAACRSGRLNPDAIPLTLAILDSIDNDALFNFDFGCL